MAKKQQSEQAIDRIIAANLNRLGENDRLVEARSPEKACRKTVNLIGEGWFMQRNVEHLQFQ
jgi:hypothetical protein